MAFIEGYHHKHLILTVKHSEGNWVMQQDNDPKQTSNQHLTG